jgi:hypothetical protein
MPEERDKRITKMATNPKRSVALFCRVRIRSGYKRENGAAKDNRRISYRLLLPV